MNVNQNQCKSTLFIIIDQTFREIIVNIQNVFNKKLGKVLNLSIFIGLSYHPIY